MDPVNLDDTANYQPAAARAGIGLPPPSTPVQVDLAALSHPGKIRPNNEDNYLVVRGGRFLETLMTSLPEGLVPREFGDSVYGMVVADGMGGMAAGEVASRLAISFLISHVLNTPDWILGTGQAQVEEQNRRAVTRFQDVNAAIIEQARHDPGLRGMGTTLTQAYSLGADLLIAHIGDSRVYLFRRGQLRKLTRDHTLAQAKADSGEIPERDVATHRLRHVLTHAIGIERRGSEPEIFRFRLEDGDRLLLCTDGLTDMVDEETISAELGRSIPAAAVCQALVDLALDRGGRDNVTVITADYRIPQES